MRLLLLLIGIFLFTTGFGQTDRFLKQLTISWKQYPANHFNIYVEEERYADQHIELVKQELENQRTGIIDFLENKNFTDTAHIIIVDTREKIKKILGFEAQGFAIPENNTVVFLYSQDYSLATKHELTHYYAFHIWGRPADNWFSEGLAVYNDNKWSGYQIDSLSKHLKDNKKLYPLSVLSRKFHSLNAMIAYPQIGSFTGYLLLSYGKPKLRELWTKGFGEIKKIYGKSLKDLEKDWLNSLDHLLSVNIDYSNHL